MSSEINEDLIETKKDDKYCYEWTPKFPHFYSKKLLRSGIFTTENNTKWIFKVNINSKEYLKRKFEIVLELIDSDCEEVHIKFNLFNALKENPSNIYSTERTIKADTPLMKTINDNEMDDLIHFEDGFLNSYSDSKLNIYWEITHTKSYLSDYKIRSALIADFRRMMGDNKFSDVIFIVNGHELFAHKAVLGARSQVFHDMFSNDLNEKLPKRVEINDIEVEVFQEFLSLLYTGSSDKFGSMTKELLVCAEKYGIIYLKLMCENILCENFTIESAIDLLLFAVKYNSENLKIKLIDYIAENYSEIKSNSSQSLIDLYKNESEIMESIVSMALNVEKYSDFDECELQLNTESENTDEIAEEEPFE